MLVVHTVFLAKIILLGDEDTILEKARKNNIDISEKTKKYLKGKISAQEMFTEGTGDVE